MVSTLENSAFFAQQMVDRSSNIDESVQDKTFVFAGRSKLTSAPIKIRIDVVLLYITLFRRGGLLFKEMKRKGHAPFYTDD